MNLETLLTEITPLPLVSFGDKRENFITGMLPDGESDLHPIATCYDKTAGKADLQAAYLVHAANVLPELVKALEDCQYTIRALTEDYDLEESYQNAQKTLTRAKEVKI